ncbi:MAG TPA: helix-turn-helix transcriptional regulator [Xanthobacteraceae bacterium]|nr:helix-turn-helix transcriptional regulator [Xanthobacteraceae bacterium]
MDQTALIDTIYEASCAPENWPQVLDALARACDAAGALLVVAMRDDLRWAASPAIAKTVATLVARGELGRDGRSVRFVARREPKFHTDLDVFTPEEVEREPFYAQVLRPHGLGWCASTTIRSPCGETIVFSIEKPHHKGVVDRHAVALLDRLRPHLARAALLSARVGLERAHANVDALETIGLPAAALTAHGRAVATDARLKACAPAITLGAEQRLHFSNNAAQSLFVEALAALQTPSGAGTGRSIPIAGHQDRPPMIAHLLPLRGCARDIFAEAVALMFVTPVTRQEAPQVEVIEALFDLTPTEARVAGAVVEGKSVAAIARAQGVTQNAVRMHLKSIFAKTGVGRQAELVSLLAMPRYAAAAP